MRPEVRIAGIKIEAVPGMTAQHAKEAKRMAEKVYPMLYVFENSARDVISGVPLRELGPAWWDQVASKPIKEETARRQKDQEKDAWHSVRGSHPINYVDLARLPDLVKHSAAWPHFKDIFGRQTWFESLVDDLNVSRRVIAHMNPISPDDVKHLESSFSKWVKQLRAKKDLLP